jgi:hypothetical protein
MGSNTHRPPAEIVRPDAHRRAGELDEAPVWRAVVAQDHGGARDAVASEEVDLEAPVVIADGVRRGDAALRRIDVVDRRVRAFQNVPKIQRTGWRQE